MKIKFIIRLASQTKNPAVGTAGFICQSAFHLLDAAGQHFELPFGDDAERLHGSRKQYRLALMDRHFVAAVVSDHAFAFDADHNDERVERRVVERQRSGQVAERRGEVGTRHQFRFAVLHLFVLGAVVGQHGVVDGALRQLGVQFAGIAVGVLAIEVVDTVGDVRSLLNLGDERARADTCLLYTSPSPRD